MKRDIIRSFGLLVTAIVIILSMDICIFAASDYVVKTNDAGQKCLVEYKGNDSKVEIPQGVEVIGESAFSKNKKIKSVILSDSVKEIGQYAFNECSNLETVKFSEGLKTIYKGAFRQCKSIKTIKINKDLKLLDEFVFAGCTSIKKVTVAKGNKNFKVKKGVLYSKNMKELYLYPPALKKTKKFTMPKSVKIVSACAFSGNKFLEKITVKSRINAGESAFSGCKSLKKVVFEKPYKWGVDFSNCKKLKTVVLAEGTKIIGESQFDGCKKLTNINFPSSLKRIDMYAFYGCDKMQNIEIPETIKVDRKAFD